MFCLLRHECLKYKGSEGVLRQKYTVFKKLLLDTDTRDVHTSHSDNPEEVSMRVRVRTAIVKVTTRYVGFGDQFSWLRVAIAIYINSVESTIPDRHN